MEYKAEAEEVLSKAIQNVVFTYNAYAPIISSFQVVYDDMIPTMGVDKYARLIVNPEFLVKNKAYAQGLVIHEVLHIFMGHTQNTRDKLQYNDDPQHNMLLNIAEDCAINQFIRESLPDGAVTVNNLSRQLKIDLRYNESSEYYYEQIMKFKEEQEKNGNGQSASDSIKGASDKNSDSTDIANSQEVQDKLEQMGVKHISQEEINDRAMDMAKSIVKGQGNQYGMLQDFAKQMLQPKVDWRPLLQATLRNAEKKIWSIRCKTTYKRTSKRSRDVLLPKKYGNKIAVTLSFDTSGSISQQMVNQFLSEVQNCLKYSEIKECALWHTQNYWYGSPQQLSNDITKVFECGGTDERCMGEAEKHCKADLHIHFSDGEHGNSFGFEHPNKNIEIVWDNDNIKDIRKDFNN